MIANETGTQTVVTAASPPPLPDEMPTGVSETGRTIRSLREERGLSEIELAGTAGLLPDHLRAIEAGTNPTLAERQAIAAALNVPADALG